MFKHHINEKINKVNKGIRVIRKLNNILPRYTLSTTLSTVSTMVMRFMISQKMNRPVLFIYF